MSKTEELNFKVKTDVSQASSEVGNLAGNFRVMGVSINDVKAGMGKIIPAAKAMFGTIKAGIMSTGIGALLIAFTSLATYFTSTKRGADELKVVFAGLGATIDVLRDRMSRVGEAIRNIFNKPLKETLGEIKDSFTGITEEIKEEVKVMTELERATQRLRDKDNEFMIQKAATRQEIERARLIAEDETKSAEERLTNLQKALDLEAKTTEQELNLARERVRIQEEAMAQSENSFEDEQKLAQLKTQLIETETASIKMRRRVVTEVNALDREIAAEKKSRDEEAQAKIDEQKAKDAAESQALIDRKKNEAQVLQDLRDENFLNAIEDEQERALAELDIQQRKEEESIAGMSNFTELKIELDKKYANARGKITAAELKDEKMTMTEKLNLAKDGFNNLSTVLGKESKAGKAAAIAAATISTYQGATQAFTSLSGIPIVGPVLGGIAAAAAIVSGFKNIQAIKQGSQSPPGNDQPDLSASSIEQAQTVAAAPAEGIVGSGAFTLGGGLEPDPVKAFVVADEMTDSQEQLGEIRRNSTL
jgi:hypothetical protein